MLAKHYYTVNHSGRTFHAPGLSPWGSHGVLLDMAVEALPDGQLLPRGAVVFTRLPEATVLVRSEKQDAKVIEAIESLMQHQLEQAIEARQHAAAAAPKILRLQK